MLMSKYYQAHSPFGLLIPQNQLAKEGAAELTGQVNLTTKGTWEYCSTVEMGKMSGIQEIPNGVF